MKTKRVAGYVISIAICEGAGVLSGFLSGDIASVYKELKLPPLSPPGWVFPVMWGILYALMGIAAYLVYAARATADEKKWAFTLFCAQLAVNISWSVVFFRFRRYLSAAFLVAGLCILIVWTMVRFYKISRAAALLLAPYLAWVLFATYINIGVYLLN